MKITLTSAKKNIVIAALLAVGALAYTFFVPDATHKVLSEQATTHTVKIMPLGDSITEGNTPELKNGYRLDLLNGLKGYSIDYVGKFKHGLDTLSDKDTMAQSGACMRDYPGCSAHMFEYTQEWVKEFQPDIVIMQSGVNDFCCGRQQQDPQVVRNMLRDWVHEVWAAKPNTYVVVVGMPPGYTYGIGYKNWIPGYVAFEAALGKKISYVPLDGVELVDGIHPDKAGYKSLAERLANTIRPMVTTIATRPQ